MIQAVDQGQSVTEREQTLVRSERSLRWGLAGALIVVLSFITLPPTISMWTASLRDRLSEHIQAFEDTRLRVENNIQSLQAATRGYVITQQPTFLEAYQVAAADIPADLMHLQELAALVDDRLVPQVADLSEQITLWQAQGPEQQVLLVQEENLAGAVAIVSTGQSQRQFDAALEQLRLLNGEIAQIDAGLTERINSVRALEMMLTLGLGTLGIGLGVYLVRVFRSIARVTRESDFQRARAEQAVVVAESANQAMLREQQRLQAVFDQSPEGILFAEMASRQIVLANQAARTLLDDPLPPGQPLPPAMLARLYRANGEALQPEEMPLHRALEGTPQIGVELTIEQQNGRRIPVLFNAAPLHNGHGQMEGAVAVFQDLSRFREVERLKSDFVAMVSHELRTPLTAIQGCVQTLLNTQNKPDPSRLDNFLHIIETQSARLHELIDNLLDMSQLEAGTFRLRTGPVQLGLMISEVVRQANVHFSDVLVQVDLGQGLPLLNVDEQRIEQVLLNLIDNAHKFSSPNSVITVRAELERDRVCISVRDQGPGIPSPLRERVFDRFYQGAPPSNPQRQEGSGGTGLGLAICRAIVEAHGGQIWVDDAITIGTRICFTIPYTRAEGVVPYHDGSARSLQQPVHGATHILIVDDEPALRQMLEGSLRNAGYVVASVAEGQSALEYLATERPDLVILDVMLPGRDGFEILRQLRDWSDVLVLMLTATPEPQNVVHGLTLGADDYLTKPFNMNELLARVDALLRRQQPWQADTPVHLQRGPIEIDVSRRTVTINGRSVDLTPIEYRLLLYFAQHPGQVLSHEQILQQVWGPEYGGESHYLWVNIGRLRQKIEPEPKSPQLIVTERGAGYRLAVE